MSNGESSATTTSSPSNPTNTDVATQNKLNANYIEEAAEELTAVLGLRVSLASYAFYKKKLNDKDREVVREIMRQVFDKLVNDIHSAKLENINVTNTINLNVTNVVQPCKGDEADEFSAERIKQLEKKLKEAYNVLQDYKAKAQKYERIQRYVNLYKQGTIDAKTLFNNILQEVSYSPEMWK